jgi:hypothetical protein
MLKLTKVARGWYATADGIWAVVIDGYTPSAVLRDEEFIDGGEWAAVHDPHGNLRVNHNDGTNIDWFPTKREAVECLQREALRA